MRKAPRALATPAIYETANIEHLGNILATLDTNKLIRSKYISGVSLLLVGVVVMLIGGGLVLTGNGAGGYILFGIPICIASIPLIRSGWKSLSKAQQLRHSGEKMQVYICDNGLIVVQNNTQPQAFRWETLLVWRSVTKYRTRGRGYEVTTDEVFFFTLQRDDGYKVVIDNNLSDLSLLDFHLRLNVLRARLPGYLAAYKAAQTLDFGRLTLSHQGIGNGYEVLPWASVRAIDAKNGSISIEGARSGLGWSSIPAESIPNVFVFLALTDTILREAGRR